MVIEPLAKELAEHTGLSWEICGPFGIQARTSIYLREDMNKSITETKTLSITLIPHWKDSALVLYYQTDKIEDNFRPETIGAINGMNFFNELLPDTIEEIVALM